MASSFDNYLVPIITFPHAEPRVSGKELLPDRDVRLEEEFRPDQWNLNTRLYSHEVFAPTELPLSHRSNPSIDSTSLEGRRSDRGIVKPRTTTAYWPEESTTCYQVRAHEVVVSRRGSDNYINGTKLLNVTGMTRGRRDGILKAEAGRKVVRSGPMNLKGVWIPFARAVEIARNEGVYQLLYPLFVEDVSVFCRESGQELLQEPTQTPSGLLDTRGLY